MTFQDRRHGESKPALVRQEPVKDTEKSADVSTNRGQCLITDIVVFAQQVISFQSHPNHTVEKGMINNETQVGSSLSRG